MSRYISRCKVNIALGAIMTANEYVGLVDELVAAIAARRLKPGDRLLPQRAFAYEKGIAASTGGRPSPGAAGGEPRDGRIDLEFNFPTVAAQFELIARSLTGLQRGDALSTS